MAGANRRKPSSNAADVQPIDGTQQIDQARRAKTKKLVLQTSSVVLAAVVLAYFNLIDHKLAMAVIVAMYLTIRFFA